MDFFSAFNSLHPPKPSVNLRVNPLYTNSLVTGRNELRPYDKTMLINIIPIH